MKDTGFTPSKNRILVSEADDSDSSVNGIVVPGKVGIGTHVYKCLVRAIGDGVTRCKVGDTVVLPLCGYELLIGNEGLRVCPEDDILGVLVEASLITL